MHYNPNFQGFQSDLQGALSLSPKPTIWVKAEKLTETSKDSLEVPQTRKEGENPGVHPWITQLQRLEQLYIFGEQTEVVQFLEAHPFLVPLLLEAYSKIKTYFLDAQLFLKVVTDPEAIDDNLETLDDHKELVIFIATDLDPDKAIDRLNQLDENWWLDASDQAEGKLNIHLEFR